jgi:hypothetical protein
MELPTLDNLEAEIAALYQEVILRPGQDNNEMLDMTSSNKGLSPDLILTMLAFIKKVAEEVESPGSRGFPTHTTHAIRDMTKEEKMKKMASLLIIVEGLVKERELGPHQARCTRLTADIQNTCNRFLDRD